MTQQPYRRTTDSVVISPTNGHALIAANLSSDDRPRSIFLKPEAVAARRHQDAHAFAPGGADKTVAEFDASALTTGERVVLVDVDSQSSQPRWSDPAEAPAAD